MDLRLKTLCDLHHDINPNYSNRPHSHSRFISPSCPLIYHSQLAWVRLQVKKASTQPYCRSSSLWAFSFAHILPFASCGLGCPSPVLYHNSHFFCSRMGQRSYIKDSIGGPHWFCLYKRIIFSWLIPHHKQVLPKKFQPYSPPAALSLDP